MRNRKPALPFMTELEQQIALAEWRGFTNIRMNEAAHGPKVLIGTLNEINRVIPDYLHSTNAIFEAEGHADKDLYPVELNKVVRAGPMPKSHFWWPLIHPTNAQRLEALLRHIRKWKD